MSTGPQIPITAVDQFTATLTKFAKSVDKSTKLASKSFQSLQKSNTKLKKDTEDTLKKMDSSYDKTKKSWKQLQAALEKDIKELGKAKGLEQHEDQIRDLSKQYDKLGKEAPDALKRLNAQTKQANESTKKLSSTATSGFSIALKAVAAFAGAQGIGALVDRAKELAPIEKGFESLTKSINSTASAMISDLQVATKGLIPDLELMRSTNQAVALGVATSREEWSQLAGDAVKLGRALGLGPTQALSNLSTALGRQSLLILDNLGITFKMNDAYKEYAERLGKTTDELTDSEKKLAFQVKAIDMLRERVAALGEQQETTGDKLAAFNADLSNLQDTIINSPAFDILVDAFTDFGRGMLDNSDELITAFSDLLEITEPLLSGLVSFAVDSISLVVGGFAAIAKELNNTGRAASDALGPIGDLINEMDRALKEDIIPAFGRTFADAFGTVASEDLVRFSESAEVARKSLGLLAKDGMKTLFDEGKSVESVIRRLVKLQIRGIDLREDEIRFINSGKEAQELFNKILAEEEAILAGTITAQELYGKLLDDNTEKTDDLSESTDKLNSTFDDVKEATETALVKYLLDVDELGKTKAFQVHSDAFQSLIKQYQLLGKELPGFLQDFNKWLAAQTEAERKYGELLKAIQKSNKALQDSIVIIEVVAGDWQDLGTIASDSYDQIIHSMDDSEKSFEKQKQHIADTTLGWEDFGTVISTTSDLIRLFGVDSDSTFAKIINSLDAAISLWKKYGDSLLSILGLQKKVDAANTAIGSSSVAAGSEGAASFLSMDMDEP